jgi:alpha 1,2-mannosyltransferase
MHNMFTVWSNFEIASLDFFRSPAYTDYFTLLESTGGFYYERWGDAPVHSLAAALFLPKSQLHFFEDIGYEHRPINHCPPLHKGWAENRCQCDWSNTFGEF